jgi:phosphohistidine phosphatase
MALYLVQHGKSKPGDTDAERGLTDEGRSEVTRIADIAKDYQIPVRVIVHSGKRRALETAEIFTKILGSGIKLERSDGMNPGDDVMLFSERLDAGKNIMYVGHLPFMEKLASYLITGTTDKTVIKFQNGGIVSFDLHPETGTWVIKWTLVPNIT